MSNVEIYENAYHRGYIDALDTLTKEIAPELKALEVECNALKRELVETLTKAATCINHGTRCVDCAHYNNNCNGCPSQLSAEEALRRLEELGNVIPSTTL